MCSNAGKPALTLEVSDMVRRYSFGVVYAVFGVLLISGMFFSAARTADAALPSGFSDTLVTNIGTPTALAFAPDGRMLITTQLGQLRVYSNGALLATPALDLSNRICTNQLRGLLGVAVDPAFVQNHYIYLFYTFNRSGSCPTGDFTSNSPVTRISRFVLGDNNIVNPASEVILINNIPQPSGHTGGDLQFGKDGYLYISSGDGLCDYRNDSGCNANNDAARDRNVLLGKILRITRNGGIPSSNPFQGTSSARCNVTGLIDPGKVCQETFAMGLRNPFRIAFDPNATATRFFINDPGQDAWEEIDADQAGADYGWNLREGPCPTGQTTNCAAPPARFTDPIFAYPDTTGCSAITGGAFPPAGIWPSAFNNAYLYGDFVCGTIFSLRPQTGGGFTAQEFATGLGSNSIVTMTFGPHEGGQALYYTTYANGGQVRRISFSGTAETCGGVTATIVGTPGDESIPGTTGPDVIAGLGGADTISGLSGNDILCGGPGNDTILSGSDRDQAFGEGGNDLVRGGGGADQVRGNAAADQLFGDEANDQLTGGDGTDRCDGGSGTDTASTCETRISIP